MFSDRVEKQKLLIMLSIKRRDLSYFDIRTVQKSIFNICKKKVVNSYVKWYGF